MPRVRRAPRNSVNDRPAKWRLLLRRHKHLLRPAAGAALVLMLGMTAYGMLRPAPGSTLATMRERVGKTFAAAGLRVTNIVVEGRANTPEPLLRAAIGVSKGDPILSFSVEDARKRIEELSWVEQATVERRLPGTIVVNLKERRPFAIWQNQGRFLLIDRNGQVVADQDVANFRKLPLVVGAGAPAAAAPLLDALTERPALQARVTAAVRVGERRWNLRMDSGADVMLPEGHETAALDRLMQLQQDHVILDRPLIAIDMRLPDRLVLRPKPEPPGENGSSPNTKKPT